jgi:hypothetical protein
MQLSPSRRSNRAPMTVIHPIPTVTRNRTISPSPRRYFQSLSVPLLKGKDDGGKEGGIAALGGHCIQLILFHLRQKRPVLREQ